jgi:hypothetical protein
MPFPLNTKPFFGLLFGSPGSSAKDEQQTSHLKDGDGEVWSDSDTF